MILIWIVFIVLLDQFTKYLAIKYLKGKGKKEGKLVYWCYVENYGAAMGLLKKWPIVLKMLSLSLLIVIGIVLIRSLLVPVSLMKRISLVMIFGGGTGNIMDRFTRGYVVDFVSPKIKKLPYFNIADFFVIIGCIVLLIAEFNV